MIGSGIVAPALAAFLTVTTVVHFEKKQAAPEPLVQIIPLELKRPDVLWRPPDINQSVMCLNSGDYIKSQMYRAALENIYTECRGETVVAQVIE